MARHAGYLCPQCPGPLALSKSWGEHCMWVTPCLPVLSAIVLRKNKQVKHSHSSEDTSKTHGTWPEVKILEQ